MCPLGCEQTQHLGIHSSWASVDATHLDRSIPWLSVCCGVCAPDSRPPPQHTRCPHPWHRFTSAPTNGAQPDQPYQPYPPPPPRSRPTSLHAPVCTLSDPVMCQAAWHVNLVTAQLPPHRFRPDHVSFSPPHPTPHIPLLTSRHSGGEFRCPALLDRAAPAIADRQRQPEPWRLRTLAPADAAAARGGAEAAVQGVLGAIQDQFSCCFRVGGLPGAVRGQLSKVCLG